MATVAKVNPHFLIADGPITSWKSSASDYSSYHIAIQGVDQRGLMVKMSESEAARLFEWLARLEGLVDAGDSGAAMLGFTTVVIGKLAALVDALI